MAMGEQDVIVRIAEAKRKRAPAPQTDVGLEDFVSVLPMRSYFFRPTGQFWAASSVNKRCPWPTSKCSPSTWLDSHSACEQVAWIPGEPELIKGRLVRDGGWVEREGCTTLNLYRPSTLEPKPGNPTPWLDHVNRVYPQDAEHIIAWLAQRVQTPGVKINHALVLAGPPGIGKDTLLEPAKRAVGAWNFAEISPQQLLGPTNGFVKSVILRVSEARDLGEIDKISFYEHSKTLCAAPPDVVTCNEKYVREHAAFNVTGVIITTNYKVGGIFLPADDRRHYVAWSDLEPTDFDDDYWKKLWGWFDESGGDAMVAHYLLNLDLSGFNPKAPPLKTPAFWQIVDAGSVPEDAEMADAIERLGSPDALTLQQVIGNGSMLDLTDFKMWLRDRKNSARIPHRMENCGYVAVHNPAIKNGVWKVGGRRQRVYAKKTLTECEQFMAAQKLADK
jgi:hypothetical protein